MGQGDTTGTRYNDKDPRENDGEMRRGKNGDDTKRSNGLFLPDLDKTRNKSTHNGMGAIPLHRAVRQLQGPAVQVRPWDLSLGPSSPWPLDAVIVPATGATNCSE